MKKKAPAWPASSARLMVPWPLITMTSGEGSSAFILRSSSMPSVSGSSRSRSTTAGRHDSNSSSARAPWLAMRTS